MIPIMGQDGRDIFWPAVSNSSSTLGAFFFMRRILILLMIAAALPAWAGITYIAETRTILGAKSDSGDFRVQGWVSGNHARIEFLRSELPGLETGLYLVSADGGETVFLVNPHEKTFERWDIGGMVTNMANMMRAMRGEMKVRFEEPTVEKLLEEDGPQIQGMPTRHFRFRTSYKASLEMYDHDTVSTVTEEDIWTTTAIAEPGVKIFLNRRSSSGDEQLDRILEREMGKVPGFPLKHVTSTRMETKKQTTETRSEMNVVEVKEVKTADALFEVPKGFEELDSNDSEMTRAMKKLKEKEKAKP